MDISGAPKFTRIVGGSETSIGNYSYCTRLQAPGTVRQMCGGAIINDRSVFFAAHCFINDPNNRWRFRVGSTNATSEGVIHNTAQIIRHPNFVRQTLDSDIAIVRVTSAFVFNSNVRNGNLASASYNLPDNQEVWSIGWGVTKVKGPVVDILHHVQIWTINREVCRNRYSNKNLITDNMLCSGWLDVGGRDQCQGNSGGPLLHNNNIVGVRSFDHECGLANYPGVNAFLVLQSA